LFTHLAVRFHSFGAMRFTASDPNSYWAARKWSAGSRRPDSHSGDPRPTGRWPRSTRPRLAPDHQMDAAKPLVSDLDATLVTAHSGEAACGHRRSPRGDAHQARQP
jgi:hypothetical protein